MIRATELDRCRIFFGHNNDSQNFLYIYTLRAHRRSACASRSVFLHFIKLVRSASNFSKFKLRKSNGITLYEWFTYEIQKSFEFTWCRWHDIERVDSIILSNVIQISREIIIRHLVKRIKRE